MATYRAALRVSCLISLSLAHLCEAECSAENAETAWLQIHKSSSDSAKAFECDPEDLACLAREMACSLRTQMERDWPTRSEYPKLDKVLSQLSSLCEGGDVRAALMERPDTQPARSKHHSVDWDRCTTDVIEYEKQNPGATYGMTAASIAASALISTIADILRSTEVMGVAGSLAFTLMNGFLGAFFPGAGGLPTNPCTYATKNWGKCVWEQVKPFVEKFVEQKLDQTFEDLWDATIQGYENSLWALNTTAYWDSKRFENGTIKDMPSSTRQRMYDDLHQVHIEMLKDAPLFLVNHSVQTTAGAYLAQFAGLHISVMTNLLGSSDYQTFGDVRVFSITSMCYAKKVYHRSTQAFAARMSALADKRVNEGTHKCCQEKTPWNPHPTCRECPKYHGELVDHWGECKGQKEKYQSVCPGYMQDSCYDITVDVVLKVFEDHRKEVEKQQVAFWQNWLAPIPLWLNNVILMQKIQPKVSDEARRIVYDFTCPP